jgi:hypothetical protein
MERLWFWHVDGGRGVSLVAQPTFIQSLAVIPAPSPPLPFAPPINGDTLSLLVVWMPWAALAVGACAGIVCFVAFRRAIKRLPVDEPRGDRVLPPQQPTWHRSRVEAPVEAPELPPPTWQRARVRAPAAPSVAGSGVVPSSEERGRDETTCAQPPASAISEHTQETISKIEELLQRSKAAHQLHGAKTKVDPAERAQMEIRKAAALLHAHGRGNTGARGDGTARQHGRK